MQNRASIRKKQKKRFMKYWRKYHPTIGIATASGKNESPSAELLLQAADKNLYQAKADGRNTVVTSCDDLAFGTAQSSI
ncbi:diguanylate cyclase domain-containing protein [Idiomarina aminovorans]|uniref:diguanylate cyclase domain-containing protein n=1 Tax=Idiomarina aminovorans TaxID=2914829 RepID=UPI00249E8B1B|nr:diguanylate cyclase [Idiomarina sp. ATCH4]